MLMSEVQIGSRGRSSRREKSLAAAPETKRERNEFPQHLIDHDEENAGERDQEQHQSGGDEGLASRRPDDLGRFRAHLLDKLERVGHFGLVPGASPARNGLFAAAPEKFAARGLSAP